MLHLGSYENLKESSMSPKIIRRKEVEQRIGLACSTIYAMMAAQNFHVQLELGGGLLVGLNKIFKIG